MIDFNLIVPAGIVQIPTTPGLARVRERTINAIVRQTLPDSLPRDKAGPWRRLLRKQLTEATDEAERNGARAVLLPVQEIRGARIPGTLVLSVLEDDDEPEDALRMLESILADAGPHGLSLEIGGGPAARVQRVIDSGDIKRRAPSVKVDYYVAAPDAPGVWGVLTFTVLTDGDVEAEPVQAIVLLFDAIVGTLRWADRFDVPTEDEILEVLDAGPAR